MKPLSHALSLLALASLSVCARADPITDWNQRSAQFVTDAKLGTPPAVRLMALVQTAAFEAARDAASEPAATEAAQRAAVAEAHRVVLTQLLPAQRAAIDAAAAAALSDLPDDAARARHAAIGGRAAQRVLAERADEMPKVAEAYRPLTTPGTYVPTAMPAVVQ